MYEGANGPCGPEPQQGSQPNFQGQPNCPPPYPPYPPYPPLKPKEVLPPQGGPWALAAALLLLSVWTANALLFGQARLGFALGALAIEGLSLGYLARRRLRLRPYAALLLLGSAGIFASFAWADHSQGGFLLILSGLGCWFLGLAQATGFTRRDPGSFYSLADGFAAGFARTYGSIGAAMRGLFRQKRSRLGGPLAGLLLAIPLLAILVPLLMRSDAAFSGLMERLLGNLWQFDELLVSLIAGLLLFLPLYTRPIALGDPGEPLAPKSEHPGSFSPTVLAGFLGSIAFFYVLYLFSQFAYFFSAFSWMLPGDFTPAEYARRGFFEMALLCAADLVIVGVSMGGVQKRPKVPALIRGLCAFFCLFSLVLIASAFSKMAYYMGAFGLTRMRVLTSAFMLCLAVCFLGVLVRLFVSRFPYMKLAVGAAAVVICALAWADVDAQVARYNVTAYESGRLESVDVDLLSTLRSSAAPYVARLTADPDPEVRQAASDAMAAWQLELFDEITVGGKEIQWIPNGAFLRDWNWRQAQARAAIEAWYAASDRP